MSLAQTLVLSPTPYKTYVLPSGNIYTADINGIITNLQSQADIASLISAGCAQLTPPPTDLLGVLLQANFNVTTDQRMSMLINGIYRIKRFVVWNASISLTTAAGGFYTGAGKTGTTLVGSGQTYTTLSSQYIAEEPTLNAPSVVLPTGTPVYFSLTTPQGAAATADIYAYGDVYE
jgi:hypothetical protein